jgi:hypothetical protein
MEIETANCTLSTLHTSTGSILEEGRIQDDRTSVVKFGLAFR